jgi:hypothetical protein
MIFSGRLRSRLLLFRLLVLLLLRIVHVCHFASSFTSNITQNLAGEQRGEKTKVANAHGTFMSDGGTVLALTPYTALWHHSDAMAKLKRKNPHAVALGRLGGLKGGLARVPKGTAALSPRERVRRAKAAAAARWKNVRRVNARGGKQ